jgi:predicted MFS family arabinose efflux permease
MFSEGVCFAINAISYIPVIISLLFIRIKYPPVPISKESTVKKIVAGWSYSWHNLPIRFLISNLAVYTLFGMSYTTLMPIFAKDVLHGNSATQGLLMSTVGIGALIGSMLLASRANIKGMPARLVYVGFAFSLALICFAFSSSIALSVFLMLFIGFTGMMTMATTNTLIQSVVSQDMRGRVISLYTMSFSSMAPFGSLMMGILSSQFGPRYTLLICSAIFLLWSLNSIRGIPKFLRGVLKMLVISKNTDVYRVRKYAPELRVL